MRLHCIVGNHAPLPPAASNQGFQFSTCSHCGRDMVRSGRSWRQVPRQFRVIWKEARMVPGHRPGVESCGKYQLPVASPRPVPVFSRLLGLVDLVRAAMRVALWACRDHWRAFSQSFRLLPRPARAVLRLPAR